MWFSLILEYPIASALMLGCVLWWAFDLRLPSARELAHRLGRATGQLLKELRARSAAEETSDITPEQFAAIRRAAPKAKGKIVSSLI